MHAPTLPDAVHPTDALLEPHGVPRKFEVHHSPTLLLQVEPFARRVRGQQHPAAGECGQRVAPLFARHAAVND